MGKSTFVQILHTGEHLVEVESCHWFREPIVVEVFHDFQHVEVLAIVEHQVIDQGLIACNKLLLII